MVRLSFLIPSSKEEFLAKTVQDIIENTSEESEVLIGLDGAWANPPIKDHPRVKIFHSSVPLGQRAITNQLARLSKAEYVCKVDAHCSFDKDFDTKMFAFMEEVGDNVVAVPIMRNLWAFDWKCQDCGWTTYQKRTPDRCGFIVGKDGKIAPEGKGCEGKNIVKDMKWIGKDKPQSTSYCFDATPHFQYFRDYTRRPEYKQMVAEKWYNESMSLQGSFFMATREKFWEWKLSDEDVGNWGNQGIELACSAWLSGGRVLCNHKTWYAHMFRTQGGDFSFPWSAKESNIQETKKNVWDKFLNMKHPTQIYPVSWLVEKFWPIPGWTDEDLKKLKHGNNN